MNQPVQDADSLEAGVHLQHTYNVLTTVGDRIVRIVGVLIMFWSLLRGVSVDGGHIDQEYACE